MRISSRTALSIRSRVATYEEELLSLILDFNLESEELRRMRELHEHLGLTASTIRQVHGRLQKAVTNDLGTGPWSLEYSRFVGNCLDGLL